MVIKVIMQMINGVCSLKRVGRVKRPLSFSTEKSTLAVCMCASSLMDSLDSGGGGGTHFDTDSIGKYLSVDS